MANSRHQARAVIVPGKMLVRDGEVLVIDEVPLEDYIEWIGGEFDPEAFDLEQVNAVLHLPRRRGYR